MRLSLIPKDRVFFTLFQRHAENTHTIAIALADLLDTFTDVADKGRKIQDLEHQGDELTHEITRRAATQFVTPLDREDILALATRLDDVADACLDASEMLVLYRVSDIHPAARQQAQVLVAATAALRDALGHLERLDGLEPYWLRIHSLESDGDQIMGAAVAGLFSGDLDPVEVLKWRDLHRVLEAAIDRCADAANIIEMIVVKHS